MVLRAEALYKKATLQIDERFKVDVPWKKQTHLKQNEYNKTLSLSSVRKMSSFLFQKYDENNDSLLLKSFVSG